MMIAFVAGMGAGVIITCAYLVLSVDRLSEIVKGESPAAAGREPGSNPRGPLAHGG